MWTIIKEKLGFGTQPASWLVWAFIILFVISGTSIFFVSYSLARHKRMVAALRVQLIAQKAELKQKEFEKEELRLQLKLQSLDKQTAVQEQERAKIRERIKETQAEIQRGKQQLATDLKALDHKKFDELVKQAVQLEKDTL